MADFISREIAIDELCEDCFMYNCSHDCDIIKVLRKVPAADVRPVVRGKWLKPKFPYAWYKCECDQCGYKAPDSGWTLEPYETDHGEKLYRDFVKNHPFCTGCGADMREIEINND